MLLNCGAGGDSWESPGLYPIHSEGNQPWVLTGRTDPEAEAPILWPSHGKRRLSGKDPDVGKVWWQEEKGTTEDEMDGQYHQIYQHDFDPTPGPNSWSMGSQRVRHDLRTKQQQIHISWEEKTPWKRPWCWESVMARGEGDDRGRDGWTVSSKLPTWIQSLKGKI